jgi:3-hydroxybutyryl-CoA dehydratase
MLRRGSFLAADPRPDAEDADKPTRRSTMYIAEIAIGQKASARDVVTRDAITEFARVSGDCNPVHLDETFAAHTQFRGCIAHGMLSAAYISKVLGMKLPGPGAIYMGQTLRFRAPVRAGDEVVTEVTVKEIIIEKHRVILETVCRVGTVVVLEGEATLMAAA